ncbi:MAG: hypothetical protein HY271_11430 [Deltaproteobacteria bacterium]|nr:hypothetical protein [Deltaproteobacteria bacterium]
MGRTRLMAEQYRSLGLLLLLVAAVTATIVASCGGGGGSSNGGLCEQCGVSPDGPCQSDAFVVPDATQPEPCPSPDSTNPNHCVKIALICRRKVDSAQQRCYPIGSDAGNPDFNFRCDGSRPGGTALPEPTTTPVPSHTLTPVSTSTPIANQVCGNGSIEGTEECEPGNLDGKSCASFCDSGAGNLNCVGCVFDFSQCTGGNCSR